MLKSTRAILAAAIAMTLATSFAGALFAQSKGKIVCWKDKSGKVIGCGDQVPPEYQDSATREVDPKSGMTRKTTGSAEEEAKRAAEAAALAKQKADEKKRLAEQARRDSALLNTYAHESEIDQRRDRELLEVDRQIAQLDIMRKNATARLEAARKASKPSDATKDEAARAEADRDKLAQNIAAKEKDKEEIRARYAQTKQRYVELRNGSAQSAAAPPKK